MKKHLSLLPLLFFVFACQHSPKSGGDHALSIMQGPTDDQSAQFNILLKTSEEVNVSVMDGDTSLPLTDTHKDGRSDSDWQVFRFTVSGLKPDTTYTLKVSDNKDHKLDERHFKALSPDVKKPKIAVISCTSDRYASVQADQWHQVWKQSPDVLFLIGDNVYVDHGPKGRLPAPTDADIWRRYVETRQNLEVYQMKDLIPIFATWDDHDFGKNDGDKNFPYNKQSQEIFHSFFPQQDNSWLLHGPGVSSALHWAGQTYVFFDDRSFRTARKVPNDSHFGAEQEKWFYGLLKKEKGPFWLISGDQFFGAYHNFESFEGNHPNSFRNFINRIKESKKTVAFLSGDRHLAEIMRVEKGKLGYTSYELTSSGLHATMFPGSLEKSGRNKRSVYGKDGELHFLLLQPEATDKGVKFKSTFYGQHSNVLFDDDFEIRR